MGCETQSNLNWRYDIYEESCNSDDGHDDCRVVIRDITRFGSPAQLNFFQCFQSFCQQSRCPVVLLHVIE